MCLKKDARRVRQARDKIGSKTLQDFGLLAKQLKSVPRKLNIDYELRNLQRLQNGNVVDPGYEISPFVLSLADDVLRGSAAFIKSVRTATSASGRVFV